MAMIPEQLKKEILAYGADHIVAIIGEQVPLRQAARNYTACCPFHPEKNPSFTVDPSRKSWRCFGACAEGGDVAKFLMKRDGISFPAALELLAARGGITIPQGDHREEHERRTLREILIKAEQFFQLCLRRNGNGAQAYVSSRMTETIVAQFGIGYAPTVKEKLQTRVVILPKGQDPDSIYRNGAKGVTLHTMSGFDYLKQSGVPMSVTMQQLHRLERLEQGVAYMARSIPAVAQLLAKRGNLGELFSPELLPVIEELITAGVKPC